MARRGRARSVNAGKERRGLDGRGLAQAGNERIGEVWL